MVWPTMPQRAVVELKIGKYMNNAENFNDG
jgi:hypothetical protein